MRELQWEVRPQVIYGSPRRLALDGAGNAYVCGERDDETGGTLLTLERYGPDGIVDWSKVYQARGYKPEMRAADLLVTSAGTSNVVGTANHVGLDPNQRLQCTSSPRPSCARGAPTARRDGPSSTTGLVAQMPSSPRSQRVREAASTRVGHTGAARGARSAEDVLVTRYRPDGKRTLTRRLGADDGHRQWAADVAVDAAGRIVVCGSWPRADRGFYVAVLRRDGAVAWTHNYGGDGTRGYASLIAVDSSGRVIAIGNGPGS